MKKAFLGPLSLGLVALALGCSSDHGHQSPATSNGGDTSVPDASNMGGETGTTSGLQPPLPVVENPDHEQLLSAATPELVRNKRLVYDFWRTLVEARDTVCIVPGCDISYGLQFDHRKDFALLGPTDLDNGGLLCPAHHDMKTFLGRLAKISSDGIPYSLFVFSGLLPWQLFSFALNASAGSLVSNTHLLTKVYFPRLIIPISSVTCSSPTNEIF